jgi:Flp pilus assembly protein protease CpaA
MNAREESSASVLINRGLEMPATGGQAISASPHMRNDDLFLTWPWTLSSPLWLVLVWLLLLPAVPLTPFTTLIGFVTSVVVAVCSYTDLRWARIRNTVTYPAILFALVIGAFDTWFCRTAEFGISPLSGIPADRVSTYLGTVGLGASLGGAGLAFLIMVPVYRIAGGGGGDVKLATALGALLGPSGVVQAILCTYLAAGLAILVWLVLTLGPLKIGEWVFRKMGSYLAPMYIGPPPEEEYGVLKGRIRLAPFFAVGALAALADADSYLGLLAGG